MKAQPFPKAWSNMEGLWLSGHTGAWDFYPIEAAKPFQISFLKHCLLRAAQLPPLCSWQSTILLAPESRLVRLPFCIPLLIYAEQGYSLFLSYLRQNLLWINFCSYVPALCQANLGSSSRGSPACEAWRCLTLAKPPSAELLAFSTVAGCSGCTVCCVALSHFCWWANQFKWLADYSVRITAG